MGPGRTAEGAGGTISLAKYAKSKVMQYQNKHASNLHAIKYREGYWIQFVLRWDRDVLLKALVVPSPWQSMQNQKSCNIKINMLPTCMQSSIVRAIRSSSWRRHRWSWRWRSKHFRRTGLVTENKKHAVHKA